MSCVVLRHSAASLFLGSPGYGSHGFHRRFSSKPNIDDTEEEAKSLECLSPLESKSLYGKVRCKVGDLHSLISRLDPRAVMAASPNHRVAAVSVSDESLVSANNADTPGSIVASALTQESSFQQPTPVLAPASASRDFSLFPRIDPMGSKGCEEVVQLLRIKGWVSFMEAVAGTNKEDFHFQPYVCGPEFTVAQMQELSQDFYGWKPLPDNSQVVVAARGKHLGRGCGSKYFCCHCRSSAH